MAPAKLLTIVDKCTNPPLLPGQGQDADLRQRGEPAEACVAGAGLHPPRMVLLRGLPAARPQLRPRPRQQQRPQRRVPLRDHQPPGRPAGAGSLRGYCLCLNTVLIHLIAAVGCPLREWPETTDHAGPGQSQRPHPQAHQPGVLPVRRGL